MTGQYTPKVPEKCHHYARFMEHLSRSQADAVYWILFVFGLLLLILASSMYTRELWNKSIASRLHILLGILPALFLCLSFLGPHTNILLVQATRTFTDAEKGDDPEVHAHKVRLRCFTVSLVCVVLAVVTTIMEAFALFHIQFCDGEDLTPLYWGFWTLLQVGACIAIFGIAMNQYYELREKDHPPWNVALGTPVLVISGLGHSGVTTITTMWRKWKARNDETPPSNENADEAPALSHYPDAINIGATPNGDPIWVIPGSLKCTLCRTMSQTDSSGGIRSQVGSGRPTSKRRSCVVRFEDERSSADTV